MQTMIQNIFMDQKSYELIQKNQDFEHICSVILNGVDTDKPQPQTIIINKIEFQEKAVTSQHSLSALCVSL